MILHHLSVTGLGGKDRSISVTLNTDLNIITGKNGSGKTTALKLMWYVISGNIERALSEVPFETAVIKTSEYNISIDRTKGAPEIIVWTDSQRHVFEARFDDDGDPFGDPVDEASDAIRDAGNSVFFPTFRRIEGGFSIRSASVAGVRNPPWATNAARARANQSGLEDAMQDLSRRMSNPHHTFVSSISTNDIVQLLMRHYTEMSERSNTLQAETSAKIISQIKDFKLDKEYGAIDNPEAILDNIKAVIERMDDQRIQILAPLTAVQTLATQLFQHAGISLGSRLSFGDAANAISSDTLSAGEKQMLSFICYNAFNTRSVVFIDEPELSLHVDWQRQLFSILQSQGTSNQFIIATHSPFIYGKFPEKEITLNQDRGDLFGAQGL